MPFQAALSLLALQSLLDRRSDRRGQAFAREFRKLHRRFVGAKTLDIQLLDFGSW